MDYWIGKIGLFIFVNVFVWFASESSMVPVNVRLNNSLLYALTGKEFFRQRADEAEVVVERARRWQRPVLLIICNLVLIWTLIDPTALSTRADVDKPLIRDSQRSR